MKEFKLRASKGGVMLTEPQGKSYMQQLIEAKEKLSKYNERLEAFKNKECKSALEIKNESIPKTKYLIALLELKKNDIILSQTAISYLEEWVISQFTGKKKDITSKYLQRGIDVEHKAIQRAARHFNCELVKNEAYLENDYFCGTFDTLIEYQMVIDVKSSWDCFTFPYFMSEPPKDYVAQLQIYMELLGVKKAALVYCLENGTDEQIERKAWELSKKAGKDEMDMDDWNEAEALLNYDHLADKNRIKVFEFDYDPEMIATLQDRVVAARDYIKNELMTQL